MTPHIRNLDVEIVDIDSLKEYARNARTHSDRQIGQIADSIVAFGWTCPVLVDKHGNVIAGHGRLAAARRLGLKKVPVIRVEDLSEDQIRAYRLADNKLAENAGWDEDLLRIEFDELIAADLDFEITETGFDMAEIDLVLGSSDEDPTSESADAGNAAEEDLEGPAIAKRGDLFLCGEDHRILCGDALDPEAYAALMQGEKAAGCFTDPPYNVRIERNVSGLGRRKHGEFTMASGEMTRDEFIAFLEAVFGLIAANVVKGALTYVCMDWRHLADAIAAGEVTFSELLNICVWAKTNGGMGSLYRSAHEHVLVFKAGKGRHVNNVQLGRYGRSRTNVWRYAGVNSFGRDRDDALAMHPTVKPVALVADAILDSTKRKDIVLDPFGGSGTILIAAHRIGRRARAIELDPNYVDVCLRRYRRVTGIDPVHAETGKTLSELEIAAEAARAAPDAADGE